MVHPCDKPCGNKTASGYCATTACINPQYSNIGTAQYGQGVQKRIVTKADKIRAMSDEELAAKIEELCQYAFMQISVYSKPFGKAEWLEWLKQEANDET